MDAYGITISLRHIDKWRMCYPNVGELDGFPHFGRVLIVATDGILAFYHVDESGQLFLGHLKAFNGPIAKQYVDEDDWDWEKRKRKVNVFRRADGSYVIVPKDKFWDAYWSKHERVSMHHLDDEDGVRVIRPKAKVKSRRQQLLESL